MAHPFRDKAKASYSAKTYVIGGRTHWFMPRDDDEYVYHGTGRENVSSIKEKGLNNMWSNWFATDPKLAMRYGYRTNIHHSEELPLGAKKPGALLRVRKSDVNQEEANNRRPRTDFWKTSEDIAPNKIDIRHQGKWTSVLDDDVKRYGGRAKRKHGGRR